jgi:lipopolysaccharide/colanic/teichoic acid biosynthesis glycosyltransferase
MNAPDLRNVDGTTYNSKSDTRQTTVGRFLRKTSIDELPQVLNVLLGHMSFIGPRPDLPEALMIYTIEEKGKLKVRPGITGYSQAYYRNSVNLKDRFMQDLFYSNNVTYLMDIKILFKTISTVIFSKDIYRNND